MSFVVLFVFDNSGNMTRTIQSELVRNGYVNKNNNIKQEMIERKEKLSKKDLEELMGIRRDTFKRVKGSVRRK